jgi:membrane fusion protein (multidrug efflux system)
MLRDLESAFEGELTTLERPRADVTNARASIDEHGSTAETGAQGEALASASVVDFAPAADDNVSVGGAGEAAPKIGSRRKLMLGVALLAFAAAASGGYLYWDHARRFESTDDAFIAARQFAVAPKVSGYVNAVLVSDNEHVAAGDVIARIDDRDYRVAFDQAEAQVVNAEAAIQNIGGMIAVQDALSSANQAQVAQAEAALAFAKQQADRYQELARNGAGSVQNAQQYLSQLQQQEAAVASAQAMFKQPKRQIEALKAQRAAAIANLAQAKAQREQAELNLAYATIKAPQSGRVVSLGASVGQYAQPGTNLAMFVPDEIWVTGNFKETQLDAMRPGQPVSLRVDAYPGLPLSGHVASIQPGSGTAFSLLPAENATGNYVKIVQRVPVKIAIDNPPTDVALGPGMSVEPVVRVDPNPSLFERLRGRL